MGFKKRNARLVVICLEPPRTRLAWRFKIKNVVITSMNLYIPVVSLRGARIFYSFYTIHSHFKGFTRKRGFSECTLCEGEVLRARVRPVSRNDNFTPQVFRLMSPVGIN